MDIIRLVRNGVGEQTMKDRDRLIELLRKSGASFENALPEEIADYLLANGVIVLPCKIGQKLYDATEFFNGCLYPEIYELVSNEMQLEITDKDNIVFTYDGMYIKREEIGKTVFLTKGEAEEKLRELKNNA